MSRPRRGDLVKIVITPKFDKLLASAGVTFLATVLDCRYRTNIYKILPANSPFTNDPYWISGDSLQVLRKE